MFMYSYVHTELELILFIRTEGWFTVCHRNLRRIASCRGTLLCHIVNRQITMRSDEKRCKNRLKFYFCAACIASNQSNFGQKHVRVLRTLYRVIESSRYRSLRLQKAYVCFYTYGKLATKATKVSKHSKVSVRTSK